LLHRKTLGQTLWLCMRGVPIWALAKLNGEEAAESLSL
jgi:hypothetical protein